MKRVFAFLFLIGVLFQVSVSQDKSFIIVGDTHYDRLTLHDWTWLRANMPSDTSQIINYSKGTAANFHDFISELAEQARTITPAVRGQVQLGDFQEGLAGSDANALTMAKEVLDSLRSSEFTTPWIITKGNHDITGPGAAASYSSIVIPWLQTELGQTVKAAYYSYRVEDVQFFVMDCYDTGSMMAYLDTALAASTAKYKILTTHMPVIPVTGRLWNIFQDDATNRTKLMNLLAKYKVLCLCGHLHKYSVVRRMTDNGPLVQIMVGSVISNRAEHSDPVATTYGGNLVDLEASFDPSSAVSRRAYLDAEAKYITDFRMTDLPGYAVLTLDNAAGGWKLKYYGGLGKYLADSVNLSLRQLKRATTGGPGTVSTAPNDSMFMIGSKVVLTAQPALGYRFVGWSGSLTSTANPDTLVMDDDKAVTATFAPITEGFELRTPVDGAGAVQRNLAGPVYPAGTKVTLTAMPDAGLKFSQWTGDTTSSASSITVTMNAHKSITAGFHLIQTYTVKGRATGMGSVALAPAGGTYTEGSPVALTASASAGWEFYQWTGDLKGTKNPDTVIASGNREVRALYKKTGKMAYEITASEDTYIRGGISYQGKNFNTDPYLLVREGSSTMNQSRAYLKFDLSSVKGNVQAAWLKLHVTPTGLPDGVPVKASAYSLSDDSWLEASLKWTGAPVLGSLLDSTTTVSQTDMDYAFDVTGFVTTKLAGSTKLMSLAVKDYALSDKGIQFDRREGTVAPKLVVVTDAATGVAESALAAPAVFALHHSYPNPFNPATTISFDLAKPGDVSLNVYDMLGRQVASLASGRMNSGSYQIQWDAAHLSSAMYIVRLCAGGMEFSEKVLLAK
jgi:hypothetical protein